MHTWVALGPHPAGKYCALTETGTPFGVIVFWKVDSIKHIKRTNTRGLRRESELPATEHKVPHERDPTDMAAPRPHPPSRPGEQ